MVLTQTITWVYKDSHLDRPTKYQYLTGMTILIPVDRIFNTIMMLILDAIFFPVDQTNLDSNTGI